jgi:hypothetical protein|tara:strand:- start:1020 stop:1178 length:159 start_codon:yes stop_codon:yes gene_type:complete
MLEENEEDRIEWKVEAGIYPGILLGIRSYHEDEYTIHVLYFPFVELALTIYK